MVNDGRPAQAVPRDDSTVATDSPFSIHNFTDLFVSTFSSRVLSVVRRIPPGRIATYGDVAAAAGQPRAWRAVGNIMRDCTARDVPCHRVVAAAGRLGGYGGSPELKKALLRAEGVMVSGARIRDFRARRWTSRGERRDGR